MDQTLDFRVQRTYTLLLNALLTEMREKPFEDITVSNLCTRAMVRRATFYKHFGDKYELFAFSIRELLSQFREQNEISYDNDRPETFYVGMVDYGLQFMEENKEICRSMLKGKNAHILLDILYEEMERDIRSHLKEDKQRGVSLPLPMALCATLIAGSLVYALRWWLLEDDPPSRQELIAACIPLVQRQTNA